MLKLFLCGQIERDDIGVEAKEDKYEYTEQNGYEGYNEAAPIFFERKL